MSSLPAAPTAVKPPADLIAWFNARGYIVDPRTGQATRHVDDGLTVYQRKAKATRKRRDAADKKFAAEFTERRRQFKEKLDAIVAAGREGGAR